MTSAKSILPEFARIAVVGSSCAGKTTFAQDLGQRLSISAFDLDALHWGPNWTPRPREDFHADLREALAGEQWIVSGNYRSAWPLFWPQLTTIIWLNYSFPTVFTRALCRTIRRIITQEPICNGNRESIRLSFFSRESILWWVITTFRRRRQEYTRLIAEKNPPDVEWIEFRTPREAAEFLSRLGANGEVMIPTIDEYRAMIDAGRRYLSGQCSIIELHGCAEHCARTAKLISAHPAIKAAADEWVGMAYRRWNEFNDAIEPLTETSFQAWLKNQLADKG